MNKYVQSIAKLNTLIVTLDESILHAEVSNHTVSQASVGWHIAHALLTITEILDDLRMSNPTNYSWRPRPLQWFLLTTRTIPRGRAKSPERVKPVGIITVQRLKRDLHQTQARITEFFALNPHQFFTHPLLGEMASQTALEFTLIHTQHHLKIIHEILAQ